MRQKKQTGFPLFATSVSLQVEYQYFYHMLVAAAHNDDVIREGRNFEFSKYANCASDWLKPMKTIEISCCRLIASAIWYRNMVSQDILISRSWWNDRLIVGTSKLLTRNDLAMLSMGCYKCCDIHELIHQRFCTLCSNPLLRKGNPMNKKDPCMWFIGGMNSWTLCSLAGRELPRIWH